MAPPRKPDNWPAMEERRKGFSDLEWITLPLHRQLGIVPEVREIATTDYVSGYGINNHLYRAKVSVARA